MSGDPRLSFIPPTSPLGVSDAGQNPTGTLTTGPDPVAEIERLLKSLEYAPSPQQHPQRPWQNIVGNLGDAVTAIAQVRAGGAPPAEGIYGRTVREKRLRFQQAQDDSLAGNRDLRNKVRLGAVEEARGLEKEKRTLAGQKELAGIKAQGRPLHFVPGVINVDGVPTQVVDVYDPTSGEYLGRNVQGEKGFAPSIQPGMIEGQSGQTESGVFKIPRGSGPTIRAQGPGGTTLRPQPPAAMAAEAGAKIGVLAGIPGLKQAFAEANQQLSGGSLQTIKTWLQAQTQGTRFEQVAEPAELQNYYSSVRSILTPYIQAVSGKQVPESEFRRYEARMPIPGVTPPEAVEAKWQSLIDEMVRDIKAKYGVQGRTPPPIPNTSAPQGGLSDEEVEAIRQKANQ